MKVTYQNSLIYKLERRFNKLRGNVILRNDIADLGGYRQLSRALQQLATEGKIARIGSGVYAKTEIAAVTGKPVLLKGFSQVAREVFTRLGVDWEPGHAEQEYNARRSTQVPVSGSVIIKDRFSRKLYWRGKEIPYERSAKITTRLRHSSSR